MLYTLYFGLLILAIQVAIALFAWHASTAFTRRCMLILYTSLERTRAEYKVPSSEGGVRASQLNR